MSRSSHPRSGVAAGVPPASEPGVPAGGLGVRLAHTPERSDARPDGETPAATFPARRFWWGLSLAYLGGLVLMAVGFRNALNTDAVSYLRLASYYAAGKWDLALSGYWGPLASWWMAPWLKLGLPPLVVARAFMVFSGCVFLWGCLAVYRAFNLPEKWVRTGAVLAGLAGLYWSVRFITPDLLLAGLLGCAASRLFAEGRCRTVRDAAGTGLLWGLAYLTKAVAFPLAFLSLLAFCVLGLRERSGTKLLLRNAAWVLLVFSLVAAPWVLMLSLKYQTPTFSTTARISHAITGPPDVERYHPFARTFHRPEPGRITSWEEPSRMDYQYWSPLHSPAYAWHQVKVIAVNSVICLVLLTSLNLAWPLALFSMLRSTSVGADVRRQSIGRALLFPALLFLIHLPCSVLLAEQRFFYSAFPFLFVALAEWGRGKSEGPATQFVGCRVKPLINTVVSRQQTAWWLALFGAVLPLAALAVLLGNSPKFAGDCAVDLAKRLERAQITGPIAGSATVPGGRTGLYVAFLTGQPWYGDEKNPTHASFKASGARLVLVIRHSALATALEHDAAFTDLDRRLFPETPDLTRFPVKVFELRR